MWFLNFEKVKFIYLGVIYCRHR